MKKLFIICSVIVIIAIVINIGLHLNRKSKNTNTEKDIKNIITDDEKNNKTDIISENEKKQYENYYNIYREKLDRPIFYAIGNTPEALPQHGVYGADYIYEIVAEGGLTRLLAIFTRGNIEKIGPIRSARHNFLDISMEYDSIFCHFGGSPKAFEQISSLKIPSLNGIALDG